MPDPVQAEDAPKILATLARLGALIRQTSFEWDALPEKEGYRLPFTVQADTEPFDVMLLPGGSAVWLLVPFEVRHLAATRIEALELVNSLNEELPFGVYYVESERLVYRNAIRLQTLTNPAELENFVLASLAAISEFTKKMTGKRAT